MMIAGQLARRLRAKTSMGDVVVGEAVGELRLSTSMGDVRVERALGTVRAKTSAGDVRVGSVRSGEVALDTTYGTLDVGVAQGTAQYHLGTCYEKLGRFTDAAQAWKKAAASAALLTEDGPPVKELAEARLAGTK